MSDISAAGPQGKAEVVLLAPPSGQLDPTNPASDAILRNAPTLAIYYLAGIVRESGYSVSTIDTVGYRSFMDDPARVLNHSLAIGISANTMTWPAALVAAQAIVHLLERPWIILGGLHPTLFDDHVLAVSGADFVVRGEGEVTLPVLLDFLCKVGRPGRGEHLSTTRLSAATIPGVSVRLEDGSVARGPDRPALTGEDLGMMPVPAYDLIPKQAYTTIPVEASRGCRFSCGFCSIMGRRNYRSVPFERVVPRIRAAVEATPRSVQGSLLFVDDCFTSSPHAAAIVSHISRHYPTVPVAVEARADDLQQPGLVRALAGCLISIIQVGIECGYAEGIRRVGKGLTLATVEDACARLVSAGLGHTLNAAFIIGFPWETVKEVADTLCYGLALARRTGALVQFGRWLPFPGSRFTDALNLSPHVFDTPRWLRDETLMVAATPRITPADWAFVGELGTLLKALFPDARAV